EVTDDPRNIATFASPTNHVAQVALELPGSPVAGSHGRRGDAGPRVEGADEVFGPPLYPGGVFLRDAQHVADDRDGKVKGEIHFEIKHAAVRRGHVRGPIEKTLERRLDERCGVENGPPPEIAVEGALL